MFVSLLQERLELMKSLQDQKNVIARERLRQVELARLRREQMKARQEEKFDAAAAVIQLAVQQDMA